MLASVSRASRARRNSRAKVCRSLLGSVMGIGNSSPREGAPETDTCGFPENSLPAWLCSGRLPNPLKEDGRNVTFAGVGQHGHDSFAGELRQLGQAHSYGGRSAAGNPGKDSFFLA